MPATVPIPAEIVGDVETLRQRKDVIQREAFCWGNALSRAVRDGRSFDYCARRIAEVCEPWDSIMSELDRRRTARDLQELR